MRAMHEGFERTGPVGGRNRGDTIGMQHSSSTSSEACQKNKYGLTVVLA
jgi:hypothetical protein